MNEALVYKWLCLGIIDADCPLIPHCCCRAVSPDGNSDLLPKVGNEWVLDWEVEREPRVHTWSVSGWIDRVKPILVKLSRKITGKSMDLTLMLNNCESLSGVVLQDWGFILLEIAHDGIIRVRQMPKSKNFLSLKSTWEAGVVNFDNIRQLTWVILLTLWNSSTYSLLSVWLNFIPKDLTWDWDDLIGIAPWNIDTSWLQEFFCGNQTFWGQLIVTKWPKKLWYKDISLKLFDINLSHISWE